MTREEFIQELTDAVDKGLATFQIMNIVNQYTISNSRTSDYKEIVKMYSCNAYGIPIDEFDKETSKQEYVNARKLYCHILSKKYSKGKRVYGDSELANDIFRSRPTVNIHNNKLEALLDSNSSYRNLYLSTVEKINNHIKSKLNE